MKLFWDKVNKIHVEDGCWLWTGYTKPEGYGQYTTTGRRKFRAHRLAYELVVGPIPDGLSLDHLCRVRNCVNPDHLQPVTTRENCRRGNTGLATGAKNRAKTRCPHGHPYSPENTYHPPSGGRACRTCRSTRAAEREARDRAARRSAACV